MMSANKICSLKHGQLTIEFDDRLYSRIIAAFDDTPVILGDFTAGEYVSLNGKKEMDFTFESLRPADVADEIGWGVVYHLTGFNERLKKEVVITFYQKFPAMALYQVTYTNTGPQPVVVDYWVNNRVSIKANPDAGISDPFWAFLPESSEARADWVQPVAPGFAQENYLGMNNSDYGGGTPVADVWRKDAGVAVGHVELAPKLVSLPVAMPDARAATLKVKSVGKPVELKPGQQLTTYRTFVAVHQGDYFAALVNYRDFMLAQGIILPTYPAAAYESIWCAWGYERDFQLDEVLGTLPKVKELGLKWVVLDDGWMVEEGDWAPMPQKFPRGDADMKAFVDAIHAQGFKVALWWAPLAVDPQADLFEKHPDYLLLNEAGEKQAITWWDCYYLCPACPEVIEYSKALTQKFIGAWGFDGLKLDGQHLNAAPPCANPAHHHPSPEAAYEAVPTFFKAIYNTALAINPEAVIEFCPCGTSYAFHIMPYFNQSVASDPESSWQIRHKGKTLKALLGRDAAYFGDHVELSDGKNDFASGIGVGAIAGTKFTWPAGPEQLDETRETEFRHWLNIYEEKQLSRGNYLGELYDLGFDRPEAHAIAKDGKLYYAFYAAHFNGTLELRGLEDKRYAVYDYVNNQDFGVVLGPVGQLDAAFERYLLLEVLPVK
jgi:alpha-galactosidase